jgi:hypothetical protein
MKLYAEQRAAKKAKRQATIAFLAKMRMLTATRDLMECW